MFSTEVKRKCIEASKIYEIKEVSKMFSVPLKSLKRWIEVGPERKKGGGRKIKEPEMEKKLIEWYNEKKIQNVPITSKMIKEKALFFTNRKDFIASKGWFEKFKKKYNLVLNKNINNNISDKNHENNIFFINLDEKKTYSVESISTSNSNKIKKINLFKVVKPIILFQCTKKTN